MALNRVGTPGIMIGRSLPISFKRLDQLELRQEDDLDARG